MNAKKWQKIKTIFNEAVELETGKRASFIESACENDEEIRAELEKLLAEDTKDETLFDPFIAPITSQTSDDPSGKYIGKYKIVREVGEGGMGSVYLAEREDLGNKVALKIVKKGMDTADLLRRFQTEQKILANLEHPNIARLLDNGTTEDGLPFYVMEYVEGETLLRYCNKNQLSTKTRLEIFRKICSAIQYAHNRLVVHRDLKPSNILITKDNEPKLLDFGIAKVLTPEKVEVKGTATLLGMMTPNYASPEQLRGETVTTASDIYSLGVILYELMTGTIPFNLKNYTLVEMMQAVSTTEPQTPSHVVGKNIPNKAYLAQLQGDLDNIILKSLKKEPDRRYLSAEQFSEDIRLHLEGLPVKARPDTFGYRTSKFIKRNKLGVAAGLLISLSLVGGIIGTTYQATVAQRERARAEKRADELQKLSNQLIFKYNDGISNLPGATSTRAMFVQEATQFLDNLANEQSNDSRIQLDLAKAYLKVGDLQSEIPSIDGKQTLTIYQKSLDILQNLVNVEPQNIEIKISYASALMNVGRLKTQPGSTDSGLGNLQQALNIREEILSNDIDNFENNVGLVDTYLSLGEYFQSIDISKAQENFQRALQLGEKLVNDPTATAPEWRLFAVANEKFGSISSPAVAINLQNRAIEFYTRVLETKPNNIKGKEELGKALIKRANIYKLLNQTNLASNDSGQAQQLFTSLLQLDPKNEGFQKLLATAKGESKNTETMKHSETVKDDLFK